MPLQNGALVGLSRQVAIERELDVVANNIANINTTGYKADGALFEEYLSSGANAGTSSGRVSFVRDRGVWHDMSQGAIEHTGNPARHRHRRQRLPRRADAARRALHAQRRAADQPHRTTRHQRRLPGAGRRRPDRAAADRQPGFDQPRRQRQRARGQLQRRFQTRQTQAGDHRQCRRPAQGRQQHLQLHRRRHTRRPRPTSASSRVRSRNRTCAASSRCRA